MISPAITISNLSKRYQIGILRHDTLRDQLAHSFSKVIRRDNSSRTTAALAPEDKLWALRDVNLTIQNGEIVGIIGRNGAGKSTLLKIISRITEPTSGRIELFGRIGSLLEVGTGFHPELTGRENIFMNGAILGMQRKEIIARFDEIIDFAEIEKFIDTPVKRYSSGMYVRLAFAVAAHLEPEILVVDEVLAVGDTAFQRKCLGKMGDIASHGRTILFVSHNMSAIQTLCTRGVYLEDGRVAMDGAIDQAVGYYLSTLEQAATKSIADRQDRSGEGRVRLVDLDISSPGELHLQTLATGRPARFAFTVSEIHPGLICTFTIFDQKGLPVSMFRSSMSSPQDTNDSGLDNTLVVDIDELLLLPGQYRINVGLRLNNVLQDRLEGAAIFQVEQGQLSGRPVSPTNQFGSVVMPHRWRLPKTLQVD